MMPYRIIDTHMRVSVLSNRQLLATFLDVNYVILSVLSVSVFIKGDLAGVPIHQFLLLNVPAKIQHE